MHTVLILALSSAIVAKALLPTNVPTTLVKVEIFAVSRNTDILYMKFVYTLVLLNFWFIQVNEIIQFLNYFF
jgi:hypothetical protein